MEIQLQSGLVEVIDEKMEQQSIVSLNELQLALVGGGAGDVVFA